MACGCGLAGTVRPVASPGVVDRVWPSGSWPRLPFRGRPKVTVKVGTPFATDGLVDSEVMAEARSQMAEMLATS